MLCEVKLLSMIYGQAEELDLPCPERQEDVARPASPVVALHNNSSEQVCDVSDSLPQLHVSQLESLDLYMPGRENSLGIEIPAQARFGGDATTFLVPSYCQSICLNYSDLHIGGDQVLPLSADNREQVVIDTQAVGPFLQSCDVPPPVEDSSPGQVAVGGLLKPLRGGSSHWRQGSGRDRSFWFQGREGPFSNSLLNHYLEQKVLDLYQQYMMENMARDRDADPGRICPLLGSEMVLTSLDQITLQLSRDGNLEAGLAKDMVLTCLLRVAGDMQSSEISTPFLQISSDASKEHNNKYKVEQK
ncbi:TLR adapter interacting with SLC15A4 on the lysosome [Dunckerocampus dactyliophorus]|uniref:TLR adapter interacting with SLC15A4 on the lysosome n=1 Tax=Dunckerocampus dactyliophorus TaxID=161453 RepID=UPI00240749C7|nr:TLR adapter interacting with SLC15A4 on the lysosome [Dunckerocampus dactyliophorus]